jgi:predicted PurR-regulated permease PerM
MSQISNNAIRQILILLLILLLGTLLFWQLKSFIPALLGSYTLYVLLRGFMRKLQYRLKWKAGLAAAVLMILSFIIILFPFYLLVNMLASKVGYALQHSSEMLSGLKAFIHTYETKYGFILLSDENIRQISGWTASSTSAILGATLETLTTLAVMYFILYFMLTEGKKMEAGFHDFVPLKEENKVLLGKELDSLVFSNALFIPLIALLQGVVALLGYWMIGVEDPLFWFVVTTIMAMLPVLGAAIAYIPLAIFFIAQGEQGKGILLLLFGFGIVGTVDNIFRFWIAKKVGDVHPLITVFGVIIGINLFGFVGLIFGPILIAMFLLLIRVYSNEFSRP